MSVRKSPKIQKLVVNAIRKLQDVEGSTPREISNYISQEYDVPSTKIQRQVRLALARAVSYGILQRSKGGYYACSRNLGGYRQPMEEAELTEKCGGGRRGRRRGKRGKSRRSRRRKSGARSKGRGGRKRRRGRSSRKRSRRGKSRRRRRGASGGGKKKSRRRRGRRGGASKKSGRRRGRSRRSRRGGGGKKCAPSGGRRGPRTDDDFDVFAGRGRRRVRSASAGRHGNRSISSGSYEERQFREKHDQTQPIDSPEILLD